MLQIRGNARRKASRFLSVTNLRIDSIPVFQFLISNKGEITECFYLIRFPQLLNVVLLNAVLIMLGEIRRSAIAKITRPMNLHG